MLRTLLVLINGLGWSGALFSCSPASQSEQHTEATKLMWQKELVRIESVLRRFPTDYEKTTYLRRYCAGLIDVGRPTAEALDYYRQTTFDNFQAYQFYYVFKQDSLPAACGITGQFYLKLAQHFGYKAYLYSFGFTDDAYARYIHSFPLVEIQYKGKKRLIVQDPYLNLTYSDKTGEPLDFYLFLKRVKRHDYQGIKLDTSVVRTALLVADTTLYWPYLNDSCRALMRQLILKPNGKIVRKIPFNRSYNTLMRSPCDPFETGFIQALSAHGYDQPFLYAYSLRVNTMVGSADVQKVQSSIDSLLSDTVGNNSF
jgi:hypothetical protein